MFAKKKICKVFIYLLFVTLLFAFIHPTGASANEFDDQMKARIDQVLQNEAVEGAIAGVSIRSGMNGQLLYAHNGNVRLTPASNMKLLTAAVALRALGPHYTFSTEVRGVGKQRKHIWKGDVYVKGKGDPTLLKEDFQSLALQLKKKGIKQISGNLIGDDSWYEHERYSIDMAWSDEQEYYGAGISALTASPTKEYDAGTVLVEIIPNSEGESASLKMTPKTKYIKINNHVTTAREKGAKEIKYVRKHGSNSITIEGAIEAGTAPQKIWIAVWEPSSYALELFHQALRDQGISVDGKIKLGVIPKKTTLLALDHSIPLSELVVPFMKLSNNTLAEMLVKEIGKVKTGEGSWNKGLQYIKSQLHTFDMDGRNIVIRDGSGLSQVNFISPNDLTSLLFHIQKELWFPHYLNSLPIAGVHSRLKGGTLRNRMKGTSAEGNVYAKTGTLTSVASLSGYANTKRGESLVFSIIINNAIDEKAIRKIEDQIAIILSE